MPTSNLSGIQRLTSISGAGMGSKLSVTIFKSSRTSRPALYGQSLTVPMGQINGSFPACITSTVFATY